MITSHQDVSVADVAAHYDDLDPYYRRFWGLDVHHGYWVRGDEEPEVATRQLVDLAAEALALAPGRRVVDVGCGYGGASRVLARDYGADVVGYTVSRAQYEAALKETAPAENPRFVCGDWLANDLSDASVDAVLAIESLEHFPDKDRFYAEAHRVLRPGGRFAACVWLSREHPSDWESRFLLRPICEEGRLPSLEAAPEHLAAIRRAGLVDAAHRDLTASVKKTWSICARRFAAALWKDKDLRRALRDPAQGNKIFSLTVFRILTAYNLGSMEYGLITAAKAP